MDEDFNKDMNFVKEGRKQSRVCKAAADTVNKELNPRSGDHHRRSNLRHRGKPPLTTTPQPPNPPALLSSGRCPPIVSKQRGREREGGVGMQAFFLDSGKRSSCGTGVFLPQTNLTKKTACPPVLLPSRVVQALKLNVQAIGVQISQNQDAKARSTSFSVVKSRNHGGKHETIECGRGVSPTTSSTAPAADIFLPKEWTY